MVSKLFQSKSCWLFDLDNTLYSPKSKIFDQIDVRMKKYISKKLKISENEAFIIQKSFYKKYGTTLYGLMHKYNFDPDHFLNFVHNVDFTNLKKSKILFKNLELLPGTKIVYTNGDEKYARKVLEYLGIINIFDEIFDIKKANYLPKPMIRPLKKLLKKNKIEPKSCVYFEDLSKNLMPAHNIGITTIHITPNEIEKSPPFINFRFKTIISALDMIKNCIN